MKVKIRKVQNQKTVNFHNVKVESLDELKYLKGPGITERAIEILKLTGHVIVTFKGDPPGEVHFHVVND